MARRRAKKRPVVIACTSEDMAVGFGPLPQRGCRARATDAEHTQLLGLFAAFDNLRKLGWQEMMYAPKDGTVFLAIEAGSTGVHECASWPNDGGWVIYDGDIWPAHPILWKPFDTHPADLLPARLREDRNG